MQVPIQIGVTPWMEIAFNPQTSYNRTQGVSSYVFNDFNVSLSFQAYKDSQARYPIVKFYLEETFPTGRYQHLNPEKLLTDAGGAGAYTTTVGVVLGQVHHFKGHHFFTWRFSPFYSISNWVSVKGFSTYGGVKETRGKLRPGNSWGALHGLEYSLTQNWAFAADLYGFTDGKSRFSGNQGTSLNGSPAAIGYPAIIQFSAAPAIEYNFSPSLGIIAGTWFTIAGKNSSRFISGVISLNYFGSTRKKPKVINLDTGGGR